MTQEQARELLQAILDIIEDEPEDAVAAIQEIEEMIINVQYGAV